MTRFNMEIDKIHKIGEKVAIAGLIIAAATAVIGGIIVAFAQK